MEAVLIGFYFIVAVVSIAFCIGMLIEVWRYKLGKFLILTPIVAIVVFVFTLVFEDQLFTRNAARKLVAEQGIVLNDRFKLLSNRTRAGQPGWLGPDGPASHRFVLVISDNDIKNAIETIENSPDFFKTDERIEHLSRESFRNYSGTKLFLNYKKSEAFHRESLLLKPEGRIHRLISICKEENKLIFRSYHYRW